MTALDFEKVDPTIHWRCSTTPHYHCIVNLPRIHKCIQCLWPLCISVVRERERERERGGRGFTHLWLMWKLCDRNWLAIWTQLWFMWKLHEKLARNWTQISLMWKLQDRNRPVCPDVGSSTKDSQSYDLAILISSWPQLHTKPNLEWALNG